MMNGFPSKKIASEKRLKVNWLHITLILAVATIPWGNNLNSLMLILFCIAGFFKNRVKEKAALLRLNYTWILSVLFFLVMLLSLLWDPNGARGLNAVEKRVSFLIIPLVLASLPFLGVKTVQTVLFVFVFSVLLVCVLCLVRSFIDYQQAGDYRVFFYQYLSNQMRLNAIYLSLYCIFCITVILQYYFINYHPLRYVNVAGAVCLCLFFFVFVLLLSSKTLIFLLFLLGIFSILYIFYIKKQLVKGAVILVAFMAVTSTLLWQLPYVRWRVQSTLVKKYEGEVDNQNGIAVRQKLWQTAVDVIKQRPLAGYGIKHGNEKLAEQYKEQNFSIALDNQYNSHNAYLQILVNVGIIGLLPLLGLLCAAFITAFRQLNYLLIMFLLMVSILGITEAVFDGQKGIVFIILFLFLLLYHSPAEFKLRSIKQQGRPAAKEVAIV